jgi:hypothetical protein
MRHFTHLKVLSAQSYVKEKCESRKTKSTDSDFVPLARESSVLCGGCAACCAMCEEDPMQLCHQRTILLKKSISRGPSALPARMAMRFDGSEVSQRVLSLPVKGKSPIFLSLNHRLRKLRSEEFGGC